MPNRLQESRRGLKLDAKSELERLPAVIAQGDVGLIVQITRRREGGDALGDLALDADIAGKPLIGARLGENAPKAAS